MLSLITFGVSSGTVIPATLNTPSDVLLPFMQSQRCLYIITKQYFITNYEIK